MDIWVDYRLDVIVPCFWILKYSVYLLFVGGLGREWQCFINPLSSSRLWRGCCSLGSMVTPESRQRIGHSGSFSALILRRLSGLAFPSRPLGYFFSGALSFWVPTLLWSFGSRSFRLLWWWFLWDLHSRSGDFSVDEKFQITWSEFGVEDFNSVVIIFCHRFKVGASLSFS